MSGEEGLLEAWVVNRSVWNRCFDFGHHTAWASWRVGELQRRNSSGRGRWSIWMSAVEK